MKERISQILFSEGFPMQKWMSNDTTLLEEKIQHDCNTQQLGESVKTLGLYWNPTSDSLRSYKMNNFVENKRVTKRTILSFISQIYDPLGLIGPVCIQAKIILQQLWQNKISWDESLPADLHITWMRYYQPLPQLKEIKIPRLIICENSMKTEIHGFCDASELAYGACLYLRSTNAKGDRMCRLICAKLRVAPLKKISLPRLELCGALLLARLMHKILQAFTLTIHEGHYWCDSTIALAWINGESSQWKTFVANRITEIHDLSTKSQWHHVRSSENPADVLSRGTRPETLNNHALWWQGPEWLTKEECLEHRFSRMSLDDIPERRNLIHTCSTITAEIDVLEKFSSLGKLRRVVAYCLRFINNCQTSKERKKGTLSVVELETATHVIIKISQTRHFSQEISALQSSRVVSTKSRLLCLNAFIDEVGLLRVGGRLRNADLAYSQKFPIILPTHDHVTTLIIRDIHLKNLHAGAETLLSLLREQYWIVSGRSVIRKILHRCLVCCRFKGKNPREIMGNLPSKRVNPARAFLNVGIDYGGPFKIKISRNKSAKAYICLFVCFATRVIHLELVSELSTSAFLNTLRRFIARRGKCDNIYSDNGSNFVGANHELQMLADLLKNVDHKKRVDTFLSEQMIQWHFLPPYSPHMGGLWEAGIKSVKTHLKKTLSEALLTFEEFYTVLTEIEACVNSRPIMPMSNDPADLNALTPGHFLIGVPLTAIPQADLSEFPLNRLTCYQLLIRLQQHFWSRWRQEYLSQLQSRYKWKNPSPENDKLNPGTLILLKDEQLPPLKWKLGRILEVHPGPDGYIRVVSIRTKDGVVKRTLPKICILPITDK